jgi:sugar (pentulose or hexulose) kinase
MTSVSALIDIGGSSVKVTISDMSTRKVYSHEVSTTPKVQGRHIYLEPSHLITDVIKAMNESADKLPPGVQVASLYISTLRQGYCLVQGSEEITPIYLNRDSSGEYARKDIENYGSKRIYEETGHWFAPQLTLPKIINLMRIKPGLIDKRSKLLFVHDWLVWKLTRIVLTEMTLVSAGQLAKLDEKKTHTELLDYFGIPASLLPEPQKFGTNIGILTESVQSELTSHWSLTKLFVGGGDSHFLHMGSSGNKRGKVVISAGSSTPISLLSPQLGTSTILQPWKSTSFADTDYLLEGNLGYPGSFYGWLQNNVADYPTSHEVNIEAVSNAPTVFGSCNMWNEQKWESRPAFLIMGDFSQANSSDLALGLTLDYAYSLAHQISALKSDGFEIEQLILTGGGATSQIQSILNCLVDMPVKLISTDVAVSNIFLILNGVNTPSLTFDPEIERLDEETSEFIKERAKSHALLYEQVEGTRKVLENAR